MDNFNKRCCRCGSDVDIEIHHIDENPKNNSIINLITMCKRCHRPFHSHLKTKYYFVSNEGNDYIEWCCNILGFKFSKGEKNE